jgi:hypothetical protein
MFKVTRAFLPLLRRARGAIVNNLSLAALAPLSVIPGYSISKAAAFNMTRSLRAFLAGQGVSVHAVFLGPIDTDMTRGFEISKSSPDSAARGIFDGLERGDEDIFPDPASEPMAEGWRSGAAKALEHQYAAFVQRARRIGTTLRIQRRMNLNRRLGLTCEAGICRRPGKRRTTCPTDRQERGRDRREPRGRTADWGSGHRCIEDARLVGARARTANSVLRPKHGRSALVAARAHAE